MDKTIYTAPEADLDTKSDYEAPDIINILISMGWKVPMAYGFFGLILVSIFALIKDNNGLNFLLVSGLPCAIIMLLSFGMFRQSRIAGGFNTLFFGFICVSQYFNLNIMGMVIFLPGMLTAFAGTVALFRFHQLKNQHDRV